MLQPPTCQLQQLRGSGEVPVCLARVDVAEIGRQQRKPGSWVAAIAVAVKDRADGESMTHVMQSRPARGRARFEAGVADPLVEGRLNVGVEQPVTRSGDEERRRVGRPTGPVASAQILTESSHSTRMQRQFAGLAKLAVADGERAVNGVKIIAIKTDR